MYSGLSGIRVQHPTNANEYRTVNTIPEASLIEAGWKPLRSDGSPYRVDYFGGGILLDGCPLNIILGMGWAPGQLELIPTLPSSIPRCFAYSPPAGPAPLPEVPTGLESTLRTVAPDTRVSAAQEAQAGPTAPTATPWGPYTGGGGGGGVSSVFQEPAPEGGPAEGGLDLETVLLPAAIVVGALLFGMRRR